MASRPDPRAQRGLPAIGPRKRRTGPRPDIVSRRRIQPRGGEPQTPIKSRRVRLPADSPVQVRPQRGAPPAGQRQASSSGLERFSAGNVPQLGAVPDLVGQVRASGGGATRAIEDRFRKAFEQIAAQQGRANKAASILPKQTRRIFQEGQQGLEGFQQDLTADVGNIPGGGINLSPELAPFQGAIQSLQTARLADQPLLETGLGQFFGAVRGGAEQAQGEALASEAARQQEAIREATLQQAQMQQQRALEQANLQAQASQQQAEFENRARFGSLEQQGFPGVGNTAGPVPRLSPQRGFQLRDRSPAVFRRISQSPKAKNFRSALAPLLGQGIPAQQAVAQILSNPTLGFDPTRDQDLAAVIMAELQGAA